ncbi:sugar ABC transporter substrate-binding protein [Streptomyces sp. SID3212]|uniref:ABC transporter substrate-binding protein n=1 Tax=Streptomyces sp. SID3212 TaxID=2690259 RepID=UPI00136B8CA7|nr:sugar ABC transporter substrate-binding protein [Streptomyces sp. SID3212]MYV54663.1 extracellular solute-binding protein [Streptomyces sp. SID3212]
MQRKSLTALVAVALAGATALTGCSSSSGGTTTAGGRTVINYWNWDPNMVTAMGACVSGFEQANPKYTVKISRYNVPDYFTKLTANFVAGNAPDVFQASGQYYPTYIAQHQIAEIGPLLKQNGYKNNFAKGIDPVTGTDGKTYGLTVDWNATGIYYNKDLLAKAGVTEAQIQDLTWNPTDGGTFGKVVKALTVDENGVHGDKPGFDAKHVATYGFQLMAPQDPNGSQTFSSFAGALGWKAGDTFPYPTQIPYADPRFSETMKYLRSLSDDGYAPKIGEFGANTSVEDQLTSGKVAMMIQGSWDVATFSGNTKVKVGVAPLVKDSKTGNRLIQGGGDLEFMWQGSKNKDGAYKWLTYMTSDACQKAAAQANPAFFSGIPAVFDTTAKQVAAKGMDISAFSNYLKSGLSAGANYSNGAGLQTAVVPVFQQYWEHQVGDSVFKQLQEKSKETIGQK